MAAITCTQCGLRRGYYGGTSVRPCPTCFPSPNPTESFENGTLATLTYLEYQEQSKGSDHSWFPMESDCLAKVLKAFPAIQETITEERQKNILSLVSELV